MRRRNRLWTLLFLGVAVVAMVLLAAGISQLELLPGQPFRLWRELEGEMGETGLSRLGEDLSLPIRALLLLSFLLLPLSIIYLIVSPEARKRVLRSLVHLLWIVALYLLVSRRPELLNREFGMSAPGAPLPPQPLQPVEYTAAPSQGLVCVSAFGLAVFLAAIVVGISWFFWRRSRRPARPLEQLAQQAREALDALQAGDDLKDTVMRCYYNMLRVVHEKRGIRRQQDVTPREFESYLEEAGLPGEYVRQLTRLFEEVRYGAKVAGEDEEREAVVCLRAIVEACGSLS